MVQLFTQLSWELLLAAHTCLWWLFLQVLSGLGFFHLKCLSVSSLALWSVIRAAEGSRRVMNSPSLCQLKSSQYDWKNSQIKAWTVTGLWLFIFSLAGAHSSLEHHTSLHCCYEGQVPPRSDWCRRSHWLWGGIFLCQDPKQTNPAEGIVPEEQ